MQSNYNNQAQAVILKGIAQQTQQMSVPTLYEVNKLYEEFDLVLTNKDYLEDLEMRSKILTQVMISAVLQGKDLKQIEGSTVGDKIITVSEVLKANSDMSNMHITQYLFPQ